MAGTTRFWPASLDIALPGVGHDTDKNWSVCTGPLTDVFVEAGSAARLDASCLAIIPPQAST